MRHWVFLLCVCLASVSTAQTQESDSRITPDQAAALNDVLEMDLLRQSTAEGFWAYRSLVCAPEPSYLAEPYLYNRTIDAGVQNELLKRTVAYGGEYAERLRPGSEAVGQDFYTLTAVTLGLNWTLPGIVDWIAFVEELRVDAAMERWGDPIRSFEELPPHESITLLRTLGIAPPYHFGSLFHEYRSLVAIAFDERTAEQMHRLRLMLPLVKQMLRALREPDPESQEP